MTGITNSGDEAKWAIAEFGPWGLFKRPQLKRADLQPEKTRRLLLLFLLAIVVQIVFLFVLLPTRYHVNDNDNYWTFYKPVAENILAGNGLVGADQKIAVTYPPGYPSVIATAFALADRIHVSREHMLDAFNILITALSSLVVFLTAREVFGEKVGLLSWLLWISYLPNLWTLVRPNSETPFMLLFYCSIWIFLRSMRKGSVRGGIIVGVTLGLAALIRPIGLFLPLVLSTAALFYGAMAKKNRIVIASLIIAGFVITVAPWEIYAMSKTRQVILLDTNGAASMYDGFVFAMQRSPEDQPMWTPAPVFSLMERAKAQRNEMQTMGSVLKFGLKEAKSHPITFAEFLGIKLYRPWYGMATRRHESAILPFQIFYLLLGAGGLIWTRRNYQEQTFSIWVFVSVIAYFWAMAFMVLPIMRYMVPPFAYMVVFVSIALDALVSRIRENTQKTLVSFFTVDS